MDAQMSVHFNSACVFVPRLQHRSGTGINGYIVARMEIVPRFDLHIVDRLFTSGIQRGLPIRHIRLLQAEILQRRFQSRLLTDIRNRRRRGSRCRCGRRRRLE